MSERPHASDHRDQDDASRVLSPLSAVRVLYSTERRAAEYDILVATALECLRKGEANVEALLVAVRQVWPSVAIAEGAFRAALAAAEAANLVYAKDHRYGLTATGHTEVQKSHEWAETLMRVTAGRLSEKALLAFRPISDQEANLWVAIIAHGLLSGIATAAAAYRGDVRLQGDALISPTAIDMTALKQAIKKVTDRNDVAEFLEAMAVEAIDPSEPFGSELVSSITTGYLLQAFLARRDAVRARDAVGPIRGQVVVVDTPVLFQLLPEETDGPLHSAIRAAATSGVEVVVGKHTIEELLAVLRRIEREYATQLAGSLASPRRLALIRRLVDEYLIELLAIGVEANRWTTWSQFRDYVVGLPKRLAEAGVAVVEYVPQDDDRLTELGRELERSLALRLRGRGFEEVRRDAKTMTLAHRFRIDRVRPSGIWPSSWVVTTDAHMAIAYRRTYKDDRDSLTIAPSQWVSVLAAFSEVQTIEELAKTGATMLAQETMLRVAARYPVPAVMEIADALADASDVEIRYAQLEADELIRDLPDHGVDPKRLGLAAAAKMLERRARHLDMAHAAHEVRLDAERLELERAAQLARELAQAARHDLSQKEDELQAALSSVATEGAQWERERLLLERRHRRNVAIGALAAAAMGLGLASFAVERFSATFLTLALGTAVSAYLLGYATADWIDNPHASARRAAWAFSGELLGVLGLAKDLGVW